MVKENCFIKQISIQAGDHLDSNSFIVILEMITDEVIISTLFPVYINLGVIHFELSQIIQKLYEYFTRMDIRENAESISTSE